MTKGKIIKKNNELGYGFIRTSRKPVRSLVPGLIRINDDDVVFTDETKLVGYEKFADVGLNDAVSVTVKKTDRGLFAVELTRVRLSP